MARRREAVSIAWCALIVYAFSMVWSERGLHSMGQTRTPDGPAYVTDAKGKLARVAERWELRRGGGEEFGVVSNLARCEDDVFLSDAQAHVFRFNVATGGALSLVADERVGLHNPSALAVDCVAGALYVVDGGDTGIVVALRIRDGSLIRKYDFALEQLSYMRSAHVVAPDSLYIAGVWRINKALSPLRTTTVDDFYDGLRIGGRLSLTSGTLEPGFAPYESRCIGAGACLFPNLDQVPDANPRQTANWIVSQATSTKVGLYDASGRLAETITVNSPLFVRNGEELSVQASDTARVRWMHGNSTIYGVAAFPQYLATIHRRQLDPNWQMNSSIPRFDIFMNLHTYSGQGLVSDILLPELPIARDANSVYVVDYGGSGRKPANRSAHLLRIPVKHGQEGFIP